VHPVDVRANVDRVALLDKYIPVICTPTDLMEHSDGY